MQAQDLASFFADKYIHSEAYSYIKGLHLAGFQPGALVSCNMRARLLSTLMEGGPSCKLHCVV